MQLLRGFYVLGIAFLTFPVWIILMIYDLGADFNTDCTGKFFDFVGITKK